MRIADKKRQLMKVRVIADDNIIISNIRMMMMISEEFRRIQLQLYPPQLFCVYAVIINIINIIVIISIITINKTNINININRFFVFCFPFSVSFFSILFSDDTDGGAAGFLRRVSIGFCPGSAEINLQKIVKSSDGRKSAEQFALILFFYSFGEK